MFFDDLGFNNNESIFLGKSVNLNDDGYLYGNMFKDEYVPYKNYSIYKLKGGNEESSLKLKIMEESFIINDLNLYLDIYPNDIDIYQFFKKHEKLLNDYIYEYQNKYGSICLNSQKDSYDWLNGSWPWEDSNV
ncbi:MAG: spore coat protein CotJB [Bacilli bacterium]|nr:spore coat protein CotJB [Bacilli bacterium]